jgi:hypothetical protein
MYIIYTVDKGQQGRAWEDGTQVSLHLSSPVGTDGHSAPLAPRLPELGHNMGHMPGSAEL